MSSSKEAPAGGWTIDTLFEGSPGARALYELVSSYIQSLGDVKISVTKTQVAFGARTKFAWVWLPQMWIPKRPRDSITLTFGLDHKVTHPRIADAVEPRPGRWTHHVLVDNESDLDDDVKAWLWEAYQSGLVDRRGKASGK